MSDKDTYVLLGQETFKLNMQEFILKAVFSGLLIATISTIAKSNDTLAALMAAFPITSSLAILLIYINNNNAEATGDLTLKIFLITLPSLSFFLILKGLIKPLGFKISYVVSIILTLLICFAYVKVMEKYFPDFL